MMRLPGVPGIKAELRGCMVKANDVWNVSNVRLVAFAVLTLLEELRGTLWIGKAATPSWIPFEMAGSTCWQKEHVARMHSSFFPYLLLPYFQMLELGQ